MKTLLALLILFPQTAPAAETMISRVNSRSLKCSELRRVVARRGAVIVYYGPSLYERVVAHGGYCEFDQVARPYHVPTRDRRACFAGYNCETRFPGDW